MNFIVADADVPGRDVDGERLADRALDVILREARSHNGWRDRPVPTRLLHDLVETVKWGPTSVNCQPMRIVFATSSEAKERLRGALMAGNVEKTMAAPVVAILGYDRRFYKHLPEQFPVMDVTGWFTGDPALAEETAFRNASMQAGYFILAARALGLDTGPMSGFDADAVDAAFFPDGRVRTNLLVNLGYGDPAALYPRGPRLPVETIARFA